MARRNESVFAHHGTTKERAGEIATTGFAQSERKWDWLGFGIYFWEDSPTRAWMWAEEKFPDDQVCIIDAQISLKRCLNLGDPEGIAKLRPWYDRFVDRFGPERAAELSSTPEGNRELDCHVINLACKRWEENDDPIHVVRCPFQEGKPIYPGAKVGRFFRFLARSRRDVPPSQIADLGHVQLAVRHDCAILDWCVEESRGE